MIPSEIPAAKNDACIPTNFLPIALAPCIGKLITAYGRIDCCQMLHQMATWTPQLGRFLLVQCPVVLKIR